MKHFCFRLQAPYTAPVDPTLRPETDFLPLDSGLTADNSTGNQPTQIHLSIAGPNAISVNWASGKYKVCKPTFCATPCTPPWQLI